MRYHTLDLVLLVVTNRSMRDANLESRFGLHIDTNYFVHENFMKCVNISPCSLYMCHMCKPKFDNIMPLIWSCWWLQIGL
jgi:hypothetical protein